MPIIRRALTVAAVTAAGTLAFALPAWAHTPHFTPTCDSVKIDLDQFATRGPNGTTNTVHILRNGQDIGGDLSPTTFGASTEIVVPEAWDQNTVTYRVTWKQGDLADNFTDNGKMFFEGTLTKPADCKVETPPTTPTTTPPAKPVSAPTTSAPAVAPTATPSQAVEADKLANTGAGNTVPLVVVGAVLVAGGVGLTFVTRRRRSGSASS